MSDQGEKTCPLCAEEMDLTDQQLKPCKCGYEICVWCWHHIMEMAEKEDIEGRCPACRTPYNKEKIVGMAEKCERLVNDINLEKKLKSHKARPKTSEGRKHLSTVRVIQRNLVYIMGIPSHLADEDLLQRREYFAQYGKVLKVSIARTAGGAIQHSPNNTCSVYITYSKEDEAVRCIQSVHSYVLEGKPLRACFGTTKYCHAWLRNTACSNPDCLYLHDIGTQEDSFTKDEIISAYTRSRVQQITGATNNLQRRSGNMLPPPVDDFCISSTASSAKPIAKSAPNNPVGPSKDSPPNCSSGRSVALPAAASWGLRVSNGRPPTPSSGSLSEAAKQRVDSNNGSLPTVDVGTKSCENEERQVPHPNGGLGLLESSKNYTGRDSRATTPDSHAEVVKNAPATSMSSNQIPSRPTSKDSDRGATTIQPNIRHTEEISGQSHASAPAADVTANGTIQGLCSSLLSIGIDGQNEVRPSDVVKPKGSDSDIFSSRSPGNHVPQQYYTEHVREPLTSVPQRNAILELDGVSVSREFSDWRSESPAAVLPEDAVLQDMDQRGCSFSDSSSRNPSRPINFSSSSIPGSADGGIFQTKIDRMVDPFASRNLILNNGSYDCKPSNAAELRNVSGSSSFFSNVEKGKSLGRLNEDTVFDKNRTAGADLGESSIISNILSLDFDSWDDSLTSPHNLVKLLNETDKQHGSLKLSSSLKVHNSNQSRFSFARQEDYVNQGSDTDNTFSNFGHMPHKYSAPREPSVDRDSYSDNFRNGFSSSMFVEADAYPNNFSIASSNKFSGSRSHASAPPGFSIPNRAPPPGFSSQERMDQAFEPITGNHLLESSLLRNQYLAQTGGIADVELIDPAILAVGKGRLPNGLDMRSSYAPQLSPSENDPRLHFLMQQQQSMSSHQNLRYPDHGGDRFSPISDPYRGGVPSRYLEQSQVSSPFGQFSLQQPRNAHHMMNGHWDGWEEVQQAGNDLAMAELLRNERLGLNKHYPSYEELKYRMPSSGDIFKRAYGI